MSILEFKEKLLCKMKNYILTIIKNRRKFTSIKMATYRYFALGDSVGPKPLSQERNAKNMFCRGQAGFILFFNKVQ